MKNRIDNSRKKTPWDNKKNKTVLQEFIEQKYVENYKYKHPRLVDTNEAIIINSINIDLTMEVLHLHQKLIKTP